MQLPANISADRAMGPILSFYWRQYPARLTLLFGILILAGLAEGIGIVALLPLVAGPGSVDGLGGAGLSWLIAYVQSFGSQMLILGFVVALIFTKAILRFASLIMSGRILAEIGTDIRMQIIDGLLRARMTYLSSQHGGRFANTLGVEASKAAGTASILLRVIAGIFQALILLAFAALTNLSATVVGVVIGILLVATFHGLARVARAANWMQADSYRQLSEQLINTLSGLKPLRAMSRQKPLRETMYRTAEDIATGYRRDVMARSAIATLQEPFIFAVIAIGFVGAGMTGVRIEEFVVVAILLYRLGTAIGQAQGSHQDLVANSAYFWSFHRAGQELARVPEAHDGRSPVDLEKDIVFSQVGYSYGERGVLRDLDLKIPYGQFVAIYGESGAGKTTMIDLLCGFDVPSSGVILIDGKNLLDLDLASWRRQIGYVPQEFTLLHDTVFNNIAIGTSADEEAVKRALVRAGAWDFVQNLPQGLQTPVGERGGRLSGGQRQRLALARALVQSPKLLILDEVTTSLDPETEAKICATFLELAGSMTIVAISHQNAIIEAADVIYEMRDGKAMQVRAKDAPAQRTKR